jgi:hypothetical protein
MAEFQSIGKLLLIAGGLIALIGLILMFSDKIPFLGKLPGDIVIKKKNFTVYIPIATSILLSIIISLILYLFRK